MSRSNILFRAAFAAALLLSISTAAKAQTRIIESGTDKLKFTVSGGWLYDERDPRYSRSGSKLNTNQNFFFDVAPGATISVRGSNAGPSIEEGGNYTMEVCIKFYDEQGHLLDDNGNIINTTSSERELNTPLSMSRTMPSNAVKAKAEVKMNRKFNYIAAFLTFTVSKDAKPNSPVIELNPAGDPCIGLGVIDSHIRFNDFWGEVKIRSECRDEDDGYEFVDLDTVIHEMDRIKTEEDSGAILGLEDMSTYVIKPETILIIHTVKDTRSKLEVNLGQMWINIKKMANGRSVVFEMSQCVAGINGTIVAFKETGSESSVWLFAGKVTVTNKSTGKETVLEPGQKIVCKGNSSKVSTFNIERVAKEWGIPMSDIDNHYSDTTEPAGSGTIEEPAGNGKYGIKSGIATMSVSTNGSMSEAVWYFDNYGAQECYKQHFEIPGFSSYDAITVTKGEWCWFIAANGSVKKFENPTPDLNFLNLSQAVRTKYKIKDLGTETFLGRTCQKYSYEIKHVLKTDKWTVWVYKGFILKSVCKSGLVESIVEATDFKENAAVPAEVFDTH